MGPHFTAADVQLHILCFLFVIHCVCVCVGDDEPSVRF